ncbi:MAG: N-acetylmuramoyl-L-alanine amidase, partial [Chloroflexi bacterium]|nr:N-acetylmuramoyl-L-alanine amidase [Chloroflexota bacterium]
MRLCASALALVALLALLVLTACSTGEPSTIASTREPASPTIAPTPSASPVRFIAVAISVPSASPTPFPIYHGGPYTVAIEAGHGGPNWFGGAGLDADGGRLLEKDLALDTALRLDELLREAGFETVLVRDGDFTLTVFDGADYRPSMIAETQARVDLANASGADILVSIHFNGAVYSSLRGTETYYNPDRSFGAESFALASFVQGELLSALAGLDHDVNDRGVRNDAEVGGDPNNAHSYLLGTNDGFRPSLMPGVISEALFLSNPDDAARIAQEETRQRLAEAYRDGIAAYFEWLPSRAEPAPAEPAGGGALNS